MLMNDISQYETTKIAGIEVRLMKIEGVRMINANDLHKASGGQKKDSPNKYLDNQKSKDLVNQLVEARPQNRGLVINDQGKVVKVVNGGNNPGTWMCEELTYNYIAWISPEFNARVFTPVKHLINGETEKATEALTGHKAYDNKLNLPDNIKEGIEIATAAGLALKAFGFNDNQALLSTDKIGRRLTGHSILELSDNLHLAAPDKEKIFTPTQIGKELDPQISAVKVNKTLQSLGYQIKIGSEWTATDKGLPFVEMLDTNKKHSDGTAVKQMKWKESIIDILKG